MKMIRPAGWTAQTNRDVPAYLLMLATRLVDYGN
jgi:hypothetical protein